MGTLGVYAHARVCATVAKRNELALNIGFGKPTDNIIGDKHSDINNSIPQAGRKPKQVKPTSYLVRRSRWRISCQTPDKPEYPSSHVHPSNKQTQTNISITP